MRPVLAAVLVFLSACSTLPRDARLDECFAGPDSGNHVVAAFDMAHARDFWDYFPAAGMAPELEVDQPAFVVVLSAPVNIPVFGGPGAHPPATNAVCVLLEDGTVNVYTDVNLDGFAT
jgi:hypothetical protein